MDVMTHSRFGGSAGRPLTAPVCGLAVMLALVAGCAGPSVQAPAVSAGLSCVDDSPQCVASRQSATKQLVGDRDRTWIKDEPTAKAYASGVRLFAFKAKKKDLTCAELSLARREAEDAPRVLRTTLGSGLTPAQVSRGTLFAAEVSRELAREHKKRCK